MKTYEYYAEAISAGSFHPALGGETANDSLAKLAKRLNSLGAEGWKLVSVERMSYSDSAGYESGPTS